MFPYSSRVILPPVARPRRCTRAAIGEPIKSWFCNEPRRQVFHEEAQDLQARAPAPLIIERPRFGTLRAVCRGMKKTILAFMLFAAGSSFAQVSIGVRIGPPPPPRVVRPSRAPGPGYIWVDGYWYPVGGRYKWHGGYWTRPPYDGARWIGPHYDGQRFFEGYWEGDRGRFDHDHRW